MEFKPTNYQLNNMFKHDEPSIPTYAIRKQLTKEDLKDLENKLEVANQQNDELINQNNGLHQQVEVLTEQIKELTPSRKSRIKKAIIIALIDLVIAVIALLFGKYII